MGRLMVLGLGNLFSRDKGLGIYAVNDLCRENWPAEVTFAHIESIHYNTLFFLGYSHLFVLDVFKAGNNPGTIHKFSGEGLVQRKDCLQCDILNKALSVAQIMRHELDVLFLGMEPDEMYWEMNLSPGLQEAYPAYLEEVRKDIRMVLSNGGSDTETQGMTSMKTTLPH